MSDWRLDPIGPKEDMTLWAEIEKQRRLHEAKEAVIEAAKELAEEIVGFAMSDGRRPTEAEGALVAKVDALEEVEGGK